MTDQDMNILHDLLNAILNRYLAFKRSDGVDVRTLSLPVEFGSPLMRASKQLKMKYGMTVNACWNWLPINDNYLNNPEDFSLKDFELRYSMSPQPEQEKYFFGASVVSSFHLARVIKAIFEMKAVLSD